MTEAEIIERFIHAAETERKMPRNDRPKGFGGYVLPFVHTVVDVQGWGKNVGDQLEPGDDPLNKEWRWGWFEKMSKLPTTANISDWEECMRWTIDLVDDEGQRRALWAWAFSKAGGRSFKRWCFDTEHIHPITGGRRRKRAIAVICARLHRDGSTHNEVPSPILLPVTPQIGDILATVEDDAGKRNDPNYWAPDAAFKSFVAVYEQSKHGHIKHELEAFSLSAKRNETRRQRDQRKKQAA